MTATLNTLSRVQRFLDQNATPLGDINASGYRKILDDVVGKLARPRRRSDDHQAGGGRRGGEGACASERAQAEPHAPRRHGGHAQLRQVPDFVALKMPPRNATSRTLINWAAAMKTAAGEYSDAFVGAGLPADFLDQLKGASVDALGNSLTNRTSNGAAQRGATIGLDAEATRGRQAVKVLDSLVEPLIQGNLALLGQWAAAKRFGGRVSAPTSTSIDAAARGPATSVAPASGDSATSPESTPAPQAGAAPSASAAAPSPAP